MIFLFHYEGWLRRSHLVTVHLFWKLAGSNFKFSRLVRNFWRCLDCHGAESLIITSFDFQRANMHRARVEGRVMPSDASRVCRRCGASGILPSSLCTLFYRDNYSVSSVGEPNYAIHCFDVVHFQFYTSTWLVYTIKPLLLRKVFALAFSTLSC